MKAFARLPAPIVLALALCVWTNGAHALVKQDSAKPCTVDADPATTGPCIDKVDPPDWFAGLPSPMLLLHGSRLTGAKFSISGNGVFLLRSEVSANGHYAFLWLSTKGAGAQSMTIRARSSSGSVTVPFHLERRVAAAHAGFSPRDVIYLIMTDRFADGAVSNDPQPPERDQPRGWHGGDFRGIEQHLDYLEQLGVTTVWLTPVYDNDGGDQAYHGYSGTDLYKTDPHFGSLADLRGLASALHAHGMKLVLDTVPNHVGANHPWAMDPPMVDWFHGTREQHRVASDRFSAVIDPHATRDQWRDVTEGWFANLLPDLNQENPRVRQYLIQNAVWWVESAGADGLRYDTFPYVGRAFWQALDAQLKILYPKLTTVGEIYNGNPVITSYFAGGVARDGIDTGLTTPFDFPLYFAVRKSLAAGSEGSEAGSPGGMAGLEHVLEQDWLYPHPERLVTFIGNHDTVRFLSQPGATVADLKMAFALLATLRGTPQIYSGDEVAMRGGGDPDNRRDFPGGFPGDTQNAFSAEGRTPDQAEVHDWVASLLQFRKHHAVLAWGEQQDVFFDDTGFVFVRTPDVKKGCGSGNGERLVVALNSSDKSRDVKLNLNRTALEGCSTFRGEIGTNAVMHSNGSVIVLTIGPQQVEIFQSQ